MFGFGARLGRCAAWATVLSSCPAVFGLGESVMLKRVYVPGTVCYVESRTEVDQDISGLPMPPMKIRFEQLYGLWEHVESVTEDKTTVVLTYDRAARNVEAPMLGTVEFDTDDPDYEEAAPQLGAVLKPMIGMAMRMELDGSGEVLHFTGMDAINRKVSESAVASMHWEQMKDDFTDARGKETWGREPLLFYANKEVKAGDSWQGVSSITEPVVGTIITDYRYEVDRVTMEDGRKTAVILVSGVISTVTNGKNSKRSDERDSNKEDTVEGGEGQVEKKAEAQAEVTGVLSGSALYDVELGRIVTRATDGTIDMSIPLRKLMPNLPEGIEAGTVEFKMGFRTTITVSTEDERKAQKAEARKKAEMRRQAEEEEDDD
ncbi:MAG: hypothetical protein JSW65_05065 [Candidatus Bipolaricaulota bacterium]|nr:MAG: hypothetical protein JSW65_05065 [Candidatus Bipolaricaulota bacterium]